MIEDIHKRKYKRIDKPYLVKFRIRPQTNRERPPSDWDMVAVKNLSATGVFFYYNEDLEANTFLDLKIDISTTTPTITCIGTIIRIKRYRNSPMVGVAIAFTEIDEKDKELLKQTAEKGP